MLSFAFVLSLKEQEQYLSSYYCLGNVIVRSYKAKYNGSMIR